MNEGKKTSSYKPIFFAIAVLLLLALSFFGGMMYQKSTTKTVDMGAVAALGTNGPSGAGRARNGAFGTVTAVSSTSITVNEPRQNTSATYAITAATSIMNSGSTGAVSDIKVGDQVIVEASSTDTKTATRIVLGMQGGFFNGGGSSGTSTSQDGGQINVQSN